MRSKKMKSVNHEKHKVDLTIVMVFVVFVVSSVLVAAHHGLGGSDTSKAVTLSGTVASTEWVNPHTVLVLDVRKAGGSMEQWTIALSPPSAMVRKGIPRDSIKNGASMSVTGYVSTTTATVRFTASEFTLPDGRKFATGNENFRPFDKSLPIQIPVQKK